MRLRLRCRRARRAAAIAAATGGLLLPTVAWGEPTPPANPATAPVGAATMHGDSLSSDTTPFGGYGSGPIRTTTIPLGAACPAALVGADGMPVILCTTIAERSPEVVLLDPDDGSVLATLSLPRGGLFSGVYTYLDERDRMVLVSGEGELLRIAHRHRGDGSWELVADERAPLADAVSGHCGGGGCDAVVGISPDWRGRVWFATGLGIVGVYDPRSGEVRTRSLGKGERVDNSISTAPGVTAVATNHALYELSARRGGRPRILWRRAYDRGPARKPGQLSYGTGATPTYFGPHRGSELLAITDNASPAEHLLVYRSVGTRSAHTGGKRSRPRPRLLCRTPVLSGFGSGTENSPIGYDRSVFVASTYGYPYPAYPEGAGESEPAEAPFTGGMTRVDLRRRGRGCAVRWEAPVRSAAVPKLSIADDLLYTVTRANPLGGSATSPFDVYSAATIDPATGKVSSSTPLGATTAYETLQLAGNLSADGVLYQGTLTGMLRIEAAG